jgi:hypothetical protein
MATHVKDLNTQVELAELLVAHAESNFVLGKARSWKLTNQGEDVLGHITPSLSTRPGVNKIHVLFAADLSAAQAVEIGQYLIDSAESLENFPKPIHVAQRKLPGRMWETLKLGEARRRFSVANAIEKDGEQVGVRFLTSSPWLKPGDSN